MGWNKITIDTLTSAEDMISYELTELGATGVEVEDHVSLTEEEMKVMYVDLLPDDIAPDDGKAKISCYFDENENLEHITMQIQAMLERLRGFMDIGAGTISFDKTKEEDWVNNWKKFFKPIRLDEQIVIKPTWETLEDQTEDMIVVEIDPGTAFGTGSHETTKLCIEGMKPYIKEDTKILDVGCGSGILSIIGLKLGAGHAVLTDIDPHAISASEENFEVNHISKDQFEVYQGNVLDDKEFAASLGSKCYPVVVANILADVISPLIEIVDQFLAEDGVFVISGIIDTKEKEIADKLNAYGFDVIETRRMKDWVSMTAKMRKEMYRFFIKEEQIHDGMIEICGSDVNHIKNVLRMKTGDKVYLSNGSDLEYECSLLEWTDDTILAKIEDVHGMETELPVKITLYQGLPKGDKMEMIVQKAVELGVAEIVPVAMKRCVVKLDAKKAAKKVSRWNTIALSAAKQAKRGIIPEVREVRNFKDILEEVQDIEFMLVPYEEAKGMQASKELISQAKGKKSIGIIIGPEGGFEKEEIEQLKAAGGQTMSLGKRILRTETAGMTVLSILMFTIEE